MTPHKIAAILAAVYGIISITSGTIGYVNKGSVVSVVAGGIAGLLLLLSAAGTFYQPTAGLIGAIVISIALIGKFASDAIHPSPDPEKQFANMNALVMAIGGVIVLLAAGYALFAGAKTSGG